MDPVVTVLRLFGTERIVGSFGLMLALALLVASFIAVRAAHRDGLDVGTVIATVGLAAGGAAVGAFGLFVLVEWARTGSVWTGLEQPGLVFFGAPLGGGLAMVFATRSFELPLGRLLDLSTPALPAAHAVGRLGCFLGGCCFGRPWDGPLAVVYTHPLAPASGAPFPRHPVPLYESAALLVLALVFSFVPLSRVGRGRRLMAYLACYGALRLVTETYRGDAVRGLYFDWLSTSQIIGVLVLVGASLGLWLTRHGVVSQPDPV